MKSSIQSSIGLILCLFFCLHPPSLPAQHFFDFLEELTQKSGVDKDQEMEAYLALSKQIPLIEGDSVIFVAHARSNTPPTLIADFNGFLNPRYVKDSTLGKMQPIPGSHWYYFIKQLPIDGIVNYAYSYAGDTHNDPLNPNQRNIFGRLRSFVAMPEYKVAPEIIVDHSLPKGEVQKMSFASKVLGHDRTLHVYLPANYQEQGDSLPTLYLHDGSFYVAEGRIPQILDYLIAHRMIRPLVAVFDDPVIRGKEYRGDTAFIKYIGEELVPFIDQSFRTSQKAIDRAIIGGSRGGLSALYLSHALPHFGHCGAFSPAITPMTIPTFTSILANYPHQPKQLYITASTFDHIWYKDAVELRQYYRSKSIDFQYQEIHEGHNIPAWRSLLDDMLAFFFPHSPSESLTR